MRLSEFTIGLVFGLGIAALSSFITNPSAQAQCRFDTARSVMAAPLPRPRQDENWMPQYSEHWADSALLRSREIIVFDDCMVAHGFRENFDTHTWHRVWPWE